MQKNDKPILYKDSWAATVNKKPLPPQPIQNTILSNNWVSLGTMTREEYKNSPLRTSGISISDPKHTEFEKWRKETFRK